MQRRGGSIMSRKFDRWVINTQIYLLLINYHLDPMVGAMLKGARSSIWFPMRGWSSQHLGSLLVNVFVAASRSAGVNS